MEAADDAELMRAGRELVAEGCGSDGLPEPVLSPREAAPATAETPEEAQNGARQKSSLRKSVESRDSDGTEVGEIDD